MKHFTSSEIKSLIKNFSLIHHPLESWFFNPTGRVFIKIKGRDTSKDSKYPFTLVRIDESELPTSLPLENLISFTDSHRKSSIYFLPNAITLANYQNTLEEKTALLDYVELSKSFIDIYLKDRDNEETENLKLNIINELEIKAKEIYNTITYHSTDIYNLEEFLNPIFWKYIDNAESFRKFLRPEDIKDFSQDLLIKKLVDKFENYKDLLHYEAFIIKEKLVYYRTSGYGNHINSSTVAIKVWEKALKKLVSFGSLKTPSILLQLFKDNLMKKNTGNNEGALKQMKLLQYCDYECVKEVYQLYFNRSETAGIAKFTKQIIENHDYQAPVLEPLLIDLKYVVIYHSEVTLNLNSIYKITNQSVIVERILDFLVEIFNEIEPDIKELNLKPDESFSNTDIIMHFILDSFSEVKAKSLESDLNDYFKILITNNFLLNHVEDFKTNDYINNYSTYIKPNIKDKFIKTLKMLRLSKKLPAKNNKSETQKI